MINLMNIKNTRVVNIIKLFILTEQLYIPILSLMLAIVSLLLKLWRKANAKVD